MKCERILIVPVVAILIIFLFSVSAVVLMSSENTGNTRLLPSEALPSKVAAPGLLLLSNIVIVIVCIVVNGAIVAACIIATHGDKKRRER